MNTTVSCCDLFLTGEQLKFKEVLIEYSPLKFILWSSPTYLTIQLERILTYYQLTLESQSRHKFDSEFVQLWFCQDLVNLYRPLFRLPN